MPAPHNGQVIHSGSSGYKTPYGQNATFLCDQGYKLQGMTELTCGGDRENGWFIGTRPTCIRMCK